jgi:tRNA G18 (ribose-2'-O)-methylase SpoU
VITAFLRVITNQENSPEIPHFRKKAFKSASKIPVVVVLDNVRSLHNVGSVFRTSDAFSIERLLLCGITATPPHKELRKTALGATESVAWEYAATTAETISALKKENLPF